VQTLKEKNKSLNITNGLIIEIKASSKWLKNFEKVFLPACLDIDSKPYLLKTDQHLQVKFCEPPVKWDKIITCFQGVLHQLENKSASEPCDIEFEIRSEKADEQADMLLQVGDELTIIPFTEKKNHIQEVKNDKNIVIESGWAFGAGTHPTTKFCLEGLLFLKERGLLKDKKVLDIGTGTAILAIAAVKLGAFSAVGVDISKEALRVARKNIKLNNLEDKIRVAASLNDINSLGPFDIISANLIPSVINPIITSIGHLCHNDTIFILSGFSPKQAKDLITNLGKMGMDNVVLQKEANGWSLLIVTKKFPCDSLIW